MPQRTARPKLSEKGLLTPENCVVAIITMVYGAPAAKFRSTWFRSPRLISGIGHACNPG